MTCKRQFESGISSILVGGSGIGCPGSENVLWTLMDPRSLEFMMVVVMVVMVMVVMVMVTVVVRVRVMVTVAVMVMTLTLSLPL